MENPFESLNQRLANIEGVLVRFDKIQVPTIGIPEAPDRYLSGEETQKLLGGVSSVSLWEWRRKGIIQGYRIGNKVFYKYSELMQCGKRIIENE